MSNDIATAPAQSPLVGLREIYLKRPQTLAIFQIGNGTAFWSALCLSRPVQCHTTALMAANPSWPRAKSLFLQHHHAQQAGYLQRFTILRWCSGSPAERVRFPGPGDKARNGRNETTFPDLKFFLLPCRLSPCWMPVFAEKKCLITNTHTLSGQRSQPPIFRKAAAQENVMCLRAC